MMIDKKIAELLLKPTVPKELPNKLHLNWKKKLEEDRCKRKNQQWKIGYSLAASIFIAVLSFTYWHSLPPNLITLAYSDIQKDSYLNNGLSNEVVNWFETNGLSFPSKTMKIKMSKFCKLDEYKAIHIRVLGEYTGEVDIFLSNINFSTLSDKTSGRIKNKNWRIISNKEKADAILVYGDDMKEKSVEKLMKKILNV